MKKVMEDAEKVPNQEPQKSIEFKKPKKKISLAQLKDEIGKAIEIENFGITCDTKFITLYLPIDSTIDNKKIKEVINKHEAKPIESDDDKLKEFIEKQEIQEADIVEALKILIRKHL